MAEVTSDGGIPWTAFVLRVTMRDPSFITCNDLLNRVLTPGRHGHFLGVGESPVLEHVWKHDGCDRPPCDVLPLRHRNPHVPLGRVGWEARVMKLLFICLRSEVTPLSAVPPTTVFSVFQCPVPLEFGLTGSPVFCSGLTIGSPTLLLLPV